MLSKGEENLVIDSGPDFRQQMLRAEVQSLEAIVYTHEHKDHIAGMDDVRAFNYKQKRDMQLYGNEGVEEALKREFYYAFTENPYPGVPRVIFNRIGDEQFKVGSFDLLPINVMHYKMPVKGFRVDNFAYITDANYIAPEEMAKLRGLDVIVINALRKEEHPSHFNLQQAIEIVNDIAPKRAYFTHISHLMGPHAEVESELPENIHIATDGLVLDL
jgi:phosphoribosyl 1,2-cyclic phosphate phosphodiesterase